jgi:hypothetical protein
VKAGRRWPAGAVMSKAWKQRPDGKTVRRHKSKALPFVMVPKYMIQSIAWRSLSGGAIAAFIELSLLYNGVELSPNFGDGRDQAAVA